jgi:hypothetical protein
MNNPTKPELPNILALYDACRTCEERNNDKWATKHWDNIRQTLLDVLPHGSGIDSDWHFEDNGNYIKCHNSYHRMNDVGMYDGWIGFSIYIRTDRRNIFGNLAWRIVGTFGKHQDIKEYLDDLFTETLNTL